MFAIETSQALLSYHITPKCDIMKQEILSARHTHEFSDAIRIGSRLFHRYMYQYGNILTYMHSAYISVIPFRFSVRFIRARGYYVASGVPPWHLVLDVPSTITILSGNYLAINNNKNLIVKTGVQHSGSPYHDYDHCSTPLATVIYLFLFIFYLFIFVG